TDELELEEKLQQPDNNAVKRWIETNQLTILQVGETGMGAGGDPEVGCAAAQAKSEDIQKFLEPLHAVILMGGGGGGSGSGILPFVAEVANKMGKSVLAVVTK